MGMKQLKKDIARFREKGLREGYLSMSKKRRARVSLLVSRVALVGFIVAMLALFLVGWWKIAVIPILMLLFVISYTVVETLHNRKFERGKAGALFDHGNAIVFMVYIGGPIILLMVGWVVFLIYEWLGLA